METRIFVFEQMGGDGRLAEKPPTGSGNAKWLDDYRAEGWHPIHWENMSPPGTEFVRYRVVMERDDATRSTVETRSRVM